MKWWIVGGILWALGALWTWCMVRTGALADQRDGVNRDDEG